MSRHHPWFAIRKELSPRRRFVLGVFSFLLPIGLWCLVSYCPLIWHPMMKIADAGEAPFFKADQLVEKSFFLQQNEEMRIQGKAEATGAPANPVYLPAPHEVGTAFFRAFKTPPRRPNQPWLHESLWHSIKVIVIAFALSSALGVPLGILCGTYDFFNRLIAPFIEFFRYLPAPAFGALAVAVLGINDAPKMSIIFIGTFFQQVLVVANTTEKLDESLLEAAQTLGARNIALLFTVVVPGILPNLYKDQRILLGWAWTYLIVAEVVGTSTGITWFINQQAKYRIYDNVFAAIIMIGIIGLATDLVLAALGRRLFAWDEEES
jgi:NitT/TauT family transport system permease protein